MLSILYQLLLFIGVILYIPFFLLRRKDGPTFLEKWGIDPLPRRKGYLLWVHAVSLGETKAIAPLVKQLHEEKPEMQIIVTFATATGKTEAEKIMPFATAFFYFPFDFFWIWRRFFKTLRPDFVIITETDFWYEFLKEAKAPIVLVNGKISLRSLKFYRLLPFWKRAIFDKIDHLYVQNSVHEQRFLSLGIPQEKITVTGNLKIDGLDVKVTNNEAVREKFHLLPEEKVIAIGSTHPNEEKMLLEELSPLIREKKLKILIAPRHPGRFLEVEKLLQKMGVKIEKLSTLNSTEYEVLLIDAMGVLKSAYQICDVAIVAGSFVSHVGGHNVLEPIAFSKPVCFGPYMHGQEEFKEIVLRYKAGKQVPLNELKPVIQTMLLDTNHSWHDACTQLIQNEKGALLKTYDCLKKSYLV